MQRVLSAGNRYPGNDSDDLRDKLAAVHRLSPDQIIISNGLTDISLFGNLSGPLVDVLVILLEADPYLHKKLLELAV